MAYTEHILFSAFVPNEDAIVSITSMGFTRTQAIKALKETDNNIERAVDYIFSHVGDLDSEPMDIQPSTTPSETYRDGSGSKSFIIVAIRCKMIIGLIYTVQIGLICPSNF